MPPRLASVPRNSDGPRQIHRFLSFGFGFQPERTETARDLAKNPAVIEDTETVVGTMRQLQDASRIIGVLWLWPDD